MSLSNSSVLWVSLCLTGFFVYRLQPCTATQCLTVCVKKLLGITASGFFIIDVEGSWFYIKSRPVAPERVHIYRVDMEP